MLAVMALVALWALTRSWSASILDRYEFRQLQTALTTYWIALDGWRLAYPTPLFGPPWSIPMEFPTYQVIVAALANLGGWPLEQTGRLVSIGFLAAALPAVYDLLGGLRLAPSRRAIVLAVILSCPVYLFYGRAFMIETTALAGAAWFLALLRRSLAHPQWGWIAATTAAATFTALTKITTFAVFGLPAAAMVIAAWRARGPGAGRNRLRLGAAGIVPALVSLALGYAWVLYGDGLKHSNPFTGFLASTELHNWNYGPWALRFDLSFWIKLQETVSGYVLAEGALAVALLCVPFAPRAARIVAAVALAGFFSGPLVFANLYHIHDYYYAANALLLTGAAGALLAAAWDDPRLPRGANWLALVMMLTFNLHAYYRGYYTHHTRPPTPPPALAGLVKSAVPADGIVLIYGADWNPLLPYYAERRTIMVPGEREHETDVLEDVLRQLQPNQRIAAMITHGQKFREQPDFIRERAQRFGLAPEPAARAGDDDLYLPATGAALAAAPGSSSAGVEVLTLPVVDAFSATLDPANLTPLDLAIFHPAPVDIHSRYGVNSADLAGRRVLNAHAPSELHFHPPAGVRQLHVVAGLPDGAFAPGGTAVTDGITIEVFASTATGTKQRLYHRALDPAARPDDRGPQTIVLDLPTPLPADVWLRLGNGAKSDPTNDWAYVAEVAFR